MLRYLGRRLAQFNPRKRSRRNVVHHDDLDGRLYSLFLDVTGYGCASTRANTAAAACISV
jgi:cyclopropane-fatty-acyl-phospholipid synthase